jgi:sulfur relay (sulfurtransferase) DsrF/TusC family protein
MKVLQIVETAYRATTEEQDDTVIWISHAMRGASAELAVLLAGNAVNYVAGDQDASGLSLGAWRQTQPPSIAQDLGALMRKDVPVYCIKEDLADRGLLECKLLEGIVLMSRAQMPRLFGEYDQVWRW